MTKHEPVDTKIDAWSDKAATGADGARHPVTGVVVGRVEAIAAGVPMVTYPQNPAAEPRMARVLTPVSELRKGDDVALMFEGGDPAKPVLIGRMETQGSAPSDLTITTDAESTRIEHPRKLMLTCGKSSIVLTADGRVALSGEYLLSAAKGLNRIAGASVKIN